MDIQTFIALCEAAGRAGGMLLGAVKGRLSEDERELLVSAAEPGATEGEFRIHVTDQTGPFVQAGDSRCIDPDDRARKPACLEAFEMLCNRGFVKFEGGHLFTLTGSGFKKARELRGSMAER